jgi:hypothetical protein
MNGHLHVLQWLREDGAAWDGRVISYSYWGPWVQLCCRMG